MNMKKITLTILFTFVGSNYALSPEAQKHADDALMRAAVEGNANRIAGALARGANPNTRDLQTGSTALMEAVTSQNVDAVRKLILADANLNTENNNRLTALDIAVMNNRRAIVIMLLDSGAKIGSAKRYAGLIEVAESKNNRFILNDIKQAWEKETSIDEQMAKMVAKQRRQQEIERLEQEIERLERELENLRKQ